MLVLTPFQAVHIRAACRQAHRGAACLKPRLSHARSTAVHAVQDDAVDWATLLNIDAPVPGEPPSSPATPANQLSSAERKAHRTHAHQLGRRLVQINMGKNGCTPAFLQGVQDCLAANEYVKIKLVGGCMMEPHEARDDIAQACDATCVHTIGFTFILYRYACMCTNTPQPTHLNTHFPRSKATPPPVHVEPQSDTVTHEDEVHTTERCRVSCTPTHALPTGGCGLSSSAVCLCTAATHFTAPRCCANHRLDVITLLSSNKYY